MRFRFNALLLLIITCGMLAPGLVAAAQTSKVRAVLFYSPTCVHCHEVMQEHLPPLVQKYPGQLDIVGVDVEHELGSNLYQSMLVRFSVPDERIGVPTLVVGDTVLVGAEEIPGQFPAIVERLLAAGGVDWPDIPGLSAVLESQASETGAAQPPSAPAQEPAESPFDKFMQEPVENSLAVVILVVMLGSVFMVGYGYLQGEQHPVFNWPQAAIPILSVLGIGVAGYLAYSYLTDTAVICGPSGGCGNVQNSEYSYLFGIIPVALLGLFGYLAILSAWALGRFGPVAFRKASVLAAWAFSWFGILFTIYLTFLEPFVIGSSCLWCLVSAVLMTMIFLATTGLALGAIQSPDDTIEDQLDTA